MPRPDLGRRFRFVLFVAALLLLYLFLIFGVAWFSLHPIRTPIFLSPATFEVPQENVTIPVEDFNLAAWWVDCDGAKTVIIFSHGYVMNRSELAGEAAWLFRKGYASLLVDLRAHGRSGGKKSGLGYFEKADLAAAAAWVRERKPGTKIVLAGTSMGAAASALAAEEIGADALILDSCYGRLAEAVNGWWRFLGGRPLQIFLAPTVWVAGPLAGFNPRRVDVADALARLRIPVLFLHGERDTLSIASDARRNAERCGGPHELVWFERCNHSEGRWIHPERYRNAMLNFLKCHGL